MEPDASRNTRERSEEGSTLGKNPDGEALRDVINKSLDDRNFRDSQVKHYHTSTCQFKKRTTYLDLPGRVFLILPACGKDMPILQWDEARDLTELGDLMFLDHGSTKIERHHI